MRRDEAVVKAEEQLAMGPVGFIEYSTAKPHFGRRTPRDTTAAHAAELCNLDNASIEMSRPG